VDAVASAAEARELMGRGPPVELCIVDEIGGRGAVLEDVRALRREYPSIPLIVIGALLSQRVMQELLRLRVSAALAKPFTPDELREAVEHTLGQSAARHGEALEFAAAVAAARRALAEGRLAAAAPPLRRARAASPFDAEVMALSALAAELEGHDGDADRGYRAALALRQDEDTPPPDPHEGLARLEAYGGARPVAALGEGLAETPVYLVTDPVTELAGALPAPCVVVTALGLSGDTTGTLFFREPRQGAGGRVFVLMADSMRAETAGAVLGRLAANGPILGSEARLDLARVAALRDLARGPRQP